MKNTRQHHKGLECAHQSSQRKQESCEFKSSFKSQTPSKQNQKFRAVIHPFYFHLSFLCLLHFQRKYLIGGVCTGLLLLSPPPSPSVTCSKIHVPLAHEGGQCLVRASPVKRDSLVVDNLGTTATERPGSD